MDKKMIFPRVVEIPTQLGKASYEKKCVFHERLLYHYLTKKITGWSVKTFLDMERIDHYVLYAVTDFTELFLEDFVQNNGLLESIWICDRNAEKFGCEFKGCPVISFEKMIHLYNKREINKIIVMSALHENEIIDDLLKNKICLNDIISFVSVLYS